MISYEYVKEQPEVKNVDVNLELICSIFKTQKELMNATNNYNYVDGDLIDYYSYQIKANKSKLDYLLKNAKARGIVIDRLKQIEIRTNHN